MNMIKYKCDQLGNYPELGQYIYHPKMGWCVFTDTRCDNRRFYINQGANGPFCASEFYTIDIDNGTQPPGREIDWDKLEPNDWYGMEVIVSDDNKIFTSWVTTLHGFYPSSPHPFFARGNVWKYCKPAPGVEIKPEWYK